MRDAEVGRLQNQLKRSETRVKRLEEAQGTADRAAQSELSRRLEKTLQAREEELTEVKRLLHEYEHSAQSAARVAEKQKVLALEAQKKEYIQGEEARNHSQMEAQKGILGIKAHNKLLEKQLHEEKAKGGRREAEFISAYEREVEAIAARHREKEAKTAEKARQSMEELQEQIDAKEILCHKMRKAVLAATHEIRSKDEELERFSCKLDAMGKKLRTVEKGAERGQRAAEDIEVLREGVEEERRKVKAKDLEIREKAEEVQEAVSRQEALTPGHSYPSPTLALPARNSPAKCGVMK